MLGAVGEAGDVAVAVFGDDEDSYRDVSGIVTPGVAWLVLLAAPLAGVFAEAAGGLLSGWVLAHKLPIRLGQSRNGSHPKKTRK